MKNKYIEQTMRFVFLAAACVSIAATITICIFLFANGVPAMLKIGLKNFIFGLKWKPSIDLYGIFPMIVGSITVTLGALILGVPLGLFTAVFLARYCPKQLYNFFESGVKLLAGIPSVVYGFFGLTVIVPAIRNIFGGNGTSILAASIVLAIMILPTVISVSASSLQAVNDSLRYASLALGATKMQTIWKVVVPAAKSGLLTGVVLGVGRALGEAMAINMVAGGAVNIPLPFNSVRTLTTQIVSEMGYAEGLHRRVLFTVGLVLYIFIMIVNFILLKARRRELHE